MNRRRHDDAQAFHEAWENGLPATGEVAELVRAAETLCARAAEQPSARFRTDLRERLMTEAATVLVPQKAGRTTPSPMPSTPTRSPARRRLAGLAAAAVASVGAISMVSTSASAVPGEVLYPVKRGVENVQLSLQGTDADRGQYQLERATERLREATAIASDPQLAAQLPDVLDDFTEQAETGSSALFGTFTTDGGPESIEQVTSFATLSSASLTALQSPDQSPELESAWKTAAMTVSTLALESSRLCGSCAKADVDDIVRSVGADTGTRADTDRSAPSSSSDAPSAAEDTPAPAPSRAPSSSGQGSAPAPQQTTAPAPAPSPTPTRPRLRDVTDPVVGGLLGDDTQEGLVPGLLDGLLGGGSRR